ncbi:MAG: FAD-dependent oxidoreductase [Patescibacteria group bacterium]|nr:FAD-dependent oxidoreductase [Patescibacteria group bacterium]
MQKIYDTVIIGGGPAAVAAGVYATRKKMDSLLVTESFGGQSIVASSIENWIGTESISGYELAASLEKHVRAQEGIEIKVGDKVVAIDEMDGGFVVKTENQQYQTKTVIICAGGRDRHLGIPGEEKFAGKGVAYCSTCDAPFFKGKDVAVVGGGNAGLEAVMDLIEYAKKITLLIREEAPDGDPQTFEEIKGIDKVDVINNAETQEIVGDENISALRFKDLKTGESQELKIQGVFVEVGVVPNSEFVKDLVRLNKTGEIVVVNPRTGQTSKNGIYAAGDVSDEKYKQNNIAVGDAIKATLSAYGYLQQLKRHE